MNIIEMAGEVDAVTKVLLDRKEPQGMSHDVFLWFLERFAALVEAAARADEREACAKVCDELHRDWKWRAAESIRARGTT